MTSDERHDAAAERDVRRMTEWLNGTSDPVTDRVIGAACVVHTALGPGLLESVYLECLSIELDDRGIPFEREVALDLRYRGRSIPVRYRLDLVVASAVVVEAKSVERVLPVHKAQLLTYLRLSGCTRGLLINFAEQRLKNGITRVVNRWVDPPGRLRSTAE
jgi:GxxExxY protein